MGRKRFLILLMALGMALWGCIPGSRNSGACFLSDRGSPVSGTQAAQAAEPLMMPKVLPDGALVAEKLVSYNGPYVEDGSQEPVENVAALMVYNAGTRDISSAMVTLVQNGKRLHFFLTWLPAGSRVLVLEHGRAEYSGEPITACESTGVRWEVFYRPSVWFWEDGGLTVINGSALPVQNLRLRYKIYVAEADYYLGGITYCAYVGSLAAGESRVIYPEQNTLGQSQVVAVLTQ